MSPDIRDFAIHVLIACVGVTWLVVLWRADRNKAYANFSILGFVTTRDGYPDRPGAMEMGTWIAVTVLMVILALHDKMTEWYMGVYIAFPAVRAGQVAWLHSGNAEPMRDRTVTDTHEETSTRSDGGEHHEP